MLIFIKFSFTLRCDVAKQYKSDSKVTDIKSDYITKSRMLRHVNEN